MSCFGSGEGSLGLGISSLFSMALYVSIFTHLCWSTETKNIYIYIYNYMFYVSLAALELLLSHSLVPDIARTYE